jgi:DNA-binding XRE family transcriptional regulator
VWLIEVFALGAMTQGRTRKDAFEMMTDWVRNALRKPEFHVVFHSSGNRAEFTMGAEQDGPLLALLLRRQRELNGVSLSEAAQRLGVSSKNAYARYERGDCNPTLGKLKQLMKAVQPNAEVVVSIR